VLEDTLNHPVINLAMTTIQLVFTVFVISVYVYRTYDMCKFDKKPIWNLGGIVSDVVIETDDTGTVISERDC